MGRFEVAGLECGTTLSPEKMDQMKSRNTSSSDTQARLRRPQPRRGILRFEALLNATEGLLTAYPDSDISQSLAAEAAAVPLPLIYRVFPKRTPF